MHKKTKENNEKKHQHKTKENERVQCSCAAKDKKVNTKKSGHKQRNVLEMKTNDFTKYIWYLYN